MTTLVGQPFGSTFAFSRIVAAQCRDASGALITKAANVPRFDHDLTGASLGLLVEPGAVYGHHDAIALVAGDWESVNGAATVLHEYEIGGVITRRAMYTTDVRATASGCLRIAAHHRLIGAVPGFLANIGGFCRYRAMIWYLGAVLATTGGQALTDDQSHLLIES